MVTSIVVSSNPSTAVDFGGPTASSTSGPKAYRCRRYASIFFCIGDVAAVDDGAAVADGACCASALDPSMLKARSNETLSAAFTFTRTSWIYGMNFCAIGNGLQ